jgi:predicted TPR repeat methyltransferase
MMEESDAIPAIDPPVEAEISIEEAMTYAIRMHKDGFVEAAARIYTRVLAQQGSNVDALNFLGVAFAQFDDLAKASQLIRAALVHAPENPDAHNNLGNVLKRQGELDGAEAAYRRALELDPSNLGALTNVGVLMNARDAHEDAVTMFRRVLAIDPDHAEAHHNLGNALFGLQRPDEALAAFEKAMSSKPYSIASYRGLGSALTMAGHDERAAAIYRKWTELAPDDAEAAHMLASVSGGENVPSRTSAEAVKILFDRFAGSFDAVLQRLKYQAPALVADTLTTILGEPKNALTMLDVGCGTGLGGPLLRPYAARLIGLDLSEGMIEQAKRRAVYDDFVVADFVEYAAEQTDAYDIVTAIDMVCYVGDMTDTARGFATTLRPGGYVAFTAEREEAEAAPNGFRLHPHGRYSHAIEYLKRELADAGLRVVRVREEVLRNELGAPVHGFAIVAQKPLS